ncbi:MAG: hypothetical protein M0Q91_17145 [Methanoregula sp.]|jgi:hypothetical protein|nr:hypothetical protein [Methanoregula sp.]
MTPNLPEKAQKSPQKVTGPGSNGLDQDILDEEMTEEKTQDPTDLYPEGLPDQPWSRLKTKRNEEKRQIKGESDEAWQAFVMFRDMPWRAILPMPRKVNTVANELDKANQLLYRWSERWDWQNRAAAFDDYMDKESIKESVWRLAEMRQRHSRCAREIQKKAMSILLKTPRGQITSQVALSMIRDGAMFERLALGEPTAILQTR